jgi:hypothetical protein
MRNTAVVTFVAMGFMAAGAVAQRQSSPAQPASPASSQSAARNGGSTGPRASNQVSTPRARTGSQLDPAPVSFDDADKNKDGKLTRREARRVPHLSFSSADANQDAAVSRQEFQAAVASARQRG